MERDLALLKIESLIINKRFQVAKAERDLSNGGWQMDHEYAIKEINREIEALMVGMESKEAPERVDPYAVDWNLVPEGFNYVATDSDGSVYAYKIEPTICKDIQLWKSYGMECVDLSIELEHNPDWKNSLRKRPGA